IVLSLALSGDSEEPPAIKVEIGPRYYVEDDLGVRELLGDLSCQLSLDSTHYERLLDLISEGALVKGSMLYHDVVGIGCDASEVPRLTAYLRPNLRRYHLEQDG
ncbi:MAG: hypothetical protein JTT11_07490, partial [Candidatus Brockarchaeota archaeon]|nr:hypothetical protein [Candidatus Brockarchaeota archaeon]